MDMFLEYYPHLIETKRDGKYPLWYNNYEAENKRRNFNGPHEDNKKIRDMIVTATIKSKKVDKMEGLLEIFQMSGGTCILSVPPLMSNGCQYRKVLTLTIS